MTVPDKWLRISTHGCQEEKWSLQQDGQDLRSRVGIGADDGGAVTTAEVLGWAGWAGWGRLGYQQHAQSVGRSVSASGKKTKEHGSTYYLFMSSDNLNIVLVLTGTRLRVKRYRPSYIFILFFYPSLFNSPDRSSRTAITRRRASPISLVSLGTHTSLARPDKNLCRVPRAVQCGRDSPTADGADA